MTPSEGARARQVNIMEEVCSVWIVKKGKTSWYAYGQFCNKTLDVTSYSSENDALSRWIDKAKDEAIQ